MVQPSIATINDYQLTLLAFWKRKKKKAMKIFTHDLTSATSLRTASFVGKAGIAPFSVTVRAPQAFAKRRASLNRSSSCQNANNKIYYDSRKYAHYLCRWSKQLRLKDYVQQVRYMLSYIRLCNEVIIRILSLSRTAFLHLVV